MGYKEGIVHVDYSESYSNKQKDEIQSAYFGQTNFSLFTACCYFRSEDVLNKAPMTVISESNNHSHIAAISCVKNVVDCLEEKMAPHQLDRNLYLE